MSELKSDIDQAEQQAKSAALSKVNAGESWLKAHRAWLVALAVAAVIGFIAGHLF